MSFPWKAGARGVVGALAPPLLAFAAARLVLSVAALSAGESPWRPGAWCRFDCAHYMRIAVTGYELFPCPADSDSAGLWCGNTAWHPGYPLLVRAARALAPAPRTAALLVSGVFALLTLVLLWAALTRRPPGGEADPPAPSGAAALPALALAAFFPGVVYAHAIFPLGPFGFATVASLLLAARGLAVASGIAGAAAAFTYPPGILLAPVLAAGFVASPRHPLATRLRSAAVSAALTAGGFAAVLAVQHHDTGSWLGFARVQSGYPNEPRSPAMTLAERVAPLFAKPFEGVDEAPGGQTLLVAILIGSALTGALLAARARRFGPLERFVVLYALAAWLLPLVVGGVSGGLHRRELTVWPLVLLTARLPRAVQVVLAAAAAAVAYPMALLFFRGALI